jgi:hypothetical protein
VRSSGSTERLANTEKQEKKRASASGGLTGAAKEAAKKARALGASAGAAVHDFVLGLVGLLTLSSAVLGGFVAYRLARQHLLR